ncbi:MAG: ribosome hibernation-promoting factor, HPF/YfiA family [Hyphomicrobiaceae bacterium]
MTLQVTGKNVDAGRAYKDYIEEKIAAVLEKYIGPEISGHIRLEKERIMFRTNCSIRLRTGILLEAHGEGADAYASADAAVDRLEKRVRRYKRRLKNHHNRDASHSEISVAARDYTVHVDETNTEEKDDDNPIIIAETETKLHSLAVSEAVMRLDLSEDPVLMFRNAGSGEINVVYRRPDGNIGWIDPNDSRTSGISENATS